MKVGQCDLATLRHSGCAWVTGASSGIGAAVSRRLVRDGWEVAGSARNNKKLEALSRDLWKTFHPYPMDVREIKTVRKSFATIEAAMIDGIFASPPTIGNMFLLLLSNE